MSHGDYLTELPEGFKITGKSDHSPICAIENVEKNIYGVQFHPEVAHTEEGKKIIDNFLFNICNCKGDWTSENFVENSINEIKNRVGTAKVICALSGGVDSTVAAVLVKKAIGKNLTCIHIDTGLMRKNESAEIKKVFDEKLNLNHIHIDASEIFLSRLKNVSDPEKKRKIIGNTFIEIFEEEAKKIKGVEYLVQGTLYPDVIESVSVKGASVTIKTHHNVGGLPEKMNLKLIEPFRELFKDEVRNVGRQLNIPEEFIQRHPFPGPGLAVRILGSVDKEKLEILRDADDIFITSIKEAGIYDKIWQAFAVLLPVQSVGVMGDARTYEFVLALRAVTSVDGMTANWYSFEPDFLSDVSNKIINKVRGINRVVYDISSKPPATIEWE
jgi:GMP synthase (glutamine-hydrolysing)